MDAKDVIAKYSDFFTKYDTELITAGAKDSIEISFFEISKFDPELADYLLNEPEESLKAMEHASENVITDKKLKFRISNMPISSEVLIRNLRSEHLEKFWSIKGIIKRKSDVRPKVTAIKFECPSCGNIITILQADKKLKQPTRCGCGRQGAFRELDRELVDGFSMVIEEFSEIVKAGSELKRLNCWVHGPLSQPFVESKVFPGVKVRITGILKPFYRQDKGGGRETQLDIFFDVNNIEILESDYEDIKISDKDREEFQELVNTGDVLNVLSSSMFSAVYGFDMVKKGLILQLVGGERKELPSGYTARGDVHILLIGDPGAGKSTCLKLVRANAPRTRYVSGKGASGVGLCVGADSTVFTSKGRMKIKELVDKTSKNETIKIFTLNEKGEGSFKKIERFWRIEDEISQRYKIKTALGYSINTTGNTGFLTKEKWKKAKDLKKGDQILTAINYNFDYSEKLKFEDFLPDKAILKNKDIVEKGLSYLKITKRAFAKKYNLSEDKVYYTWKRNGISFKDFKLISKENNLPRKMEIHGYKTPNSVNLDLDDPELYYLIGLIFGDGNLDNNSIRFYNKDQELLNRYKSQLNKLNINYNEGINKGVNFIRFGSLTFSSLCRYLGLNGTKDKLDISSFPLNKKHIKSFLQGVFDTDGAVEKTYGRVSLSSISLPFIKRVQEFLLFFGIRSGIRTRKGKNVKFPSGKTYFCRKKYSLTILSDYVKIFHNNIGFRLKRKQNDLKSVLKEYQPINRINEGYWDKIKSINKTNQCELYDLTVADTHSYIANNILVHNTASVVRDELLGGYALEAGALPLTHHGTLICDEFDKLAETETDAIHEALEEQTISIAKANIQATLRCETSLLAAANPKYGRFDVSEPLSTQIKLPPALITRFDLIFLFLDQPNEENDKEMAKKILSRNREIRDPLMSPAKVKKFLAYAKQFHPTYSSKIEDEIVNFYTVIRNAPRKEGSKAVPISPRYIEVVRRLSEAHAKIHLRDRIEIEDVETAIDLVMFTLKKLAIDPETGELDVDIIATGYSSSGRSKRLRFLDIIEKLSEKMKEMPYEEVINALKAAYFTEVEANELIRKAKKAGELFEPRNGILKKM